MYISPLELLTATLAASIATTKPNPPQPRGAAFIFPCDNEAASAVVNTGSKSSRVLTEALWIFVEVEHQAGVSVRLNQIAGKANVIADALSRDQLLRAFPLLHVHGRPHRFGTPAERGDWLLRLSGGPERDGR